MQGNTAISLRLFPTVKDLWEKRLITSFTTPTNDGLGPIEGLLASSDPDLLSV